MTTTSPGIATLLDHERFVRALALSLVRDPSAADDLVQDTWLAVLRNPPQSLRAARAWLSTVMRNQLGNARRAELRRAAREQAVARHEADANELRERVALEHGIVAAVMELREPYRTVVLLRYYEGLDAAEIARRRGVPAATVRSQLKRGLDQLRERLDERPGGRAAWCALLLPAVRRAPPRLVAVKAAAGAAVLAGGAALALLGGSSSDAAPMRMADLAASPAVVRSHASAEPTGPRRSLAAPDVERVAVAPIAQDPDLSALSVDELLELALHAQALLRARLLEPDPQLVRKSKVQGLADAGVARILRSERFLATEQLGMRGGGCYFSFRTLSHDYDAEPDLALQAGRFDSGFAGAAEGYLLDAGDLELTEIARTPPSGLPAERRRAWEHLWIDADMDERGFDAEWRARAREVPFETSPKASVGRTWLLRAILPGRHDHLVAFRSLASDEFGHTIEWRILRRFEAFDASPASSPRTAPGAPPAWLAAKDARRLLDALDAIRTAAAARLLVVPQQAAELATRFGEQGGACRILHRDRFQPVLALQGGGTFWSFVTQSHDYRQEPDLDLQLGRYSSGFAGGECGYLLDLGPLDLGIADREPPHLDEDARRAWRFLRGFRSSRDARSGEFLVDDADAERARSLGLDEPVAAIAGHTYLLRSICEHDVTVAFTTVDVDDAGHTLVWRILDLQR